jgi:hypothetical protein
MSTLNYFDQVRISVPLLSKVEDFHCSSLRNFVKIVAKAVKYGEQKITAVIEGKIHRENETEEAIRRNPLCLVKWYNNTTTSIALSELLRRGNQMINGGVIFGVLGQMGDIGIIIKYIKGIEGQQIIKTRIVFQGEKNGHYDRRHMFLRELKCECSELLGMGKCLCISHPMFVNTPLTKEEAQKYFEINDLGHDWLQQMYKTSQKSSPDKDINELIPYFGVCEE